MLSTVTSCAEPWTAHLLRGRLIAEGVAAVVAHEHHVGNLWPYTLALGGVKVQVPDSQLEMAREIVARCRSGDYQDELDPGPDRLVPLHCPSCGSAIVMSRPAFKWSILLILSYL
jgi:hypothetical protein